MTTNFKEMGLSYSVKYSDYATISVVDWARFFPVINVQAEKLLISIATNYWCAKVAYKSKINDFIFDIRIDGIERRYSIDQRVGYKSYDDYQYLFIKFLCPYSENDVRRYVWINMLKQYNYVKICRDTQDVLIDLLVGKNDYKY